MIVNHMRLKASDIKEARRRKNDMTQRQLADELRMNIFTIYKAESEAELNPSTAQAICAFLGLDLDATAITEEVNGNGSVA